MEDWQIALIVMVCVILVVLLLMLCFRLRRKNVVYVENYDSTYEKNHINQTKQQFNQDLQDQILQDQINDVRYKRIDAKTEDEYKRFDEQLSELKRMRDANFTTRKK
jgi:uncharacterized protein YpmS